MRSAVHTPHGLLSAVLVVAAVSVTSVALLINPAATCGAFAVAVTLAGVRAVGVTFPAALLAGSALVYLAAGPAIVAGILPSAVGQLGTLAAIAAGVLVVVQRTMVRPVHPRVRFPELTWGLGAFIAIVCVAVVNPALPSIGYGAGGARPLLTPLILLLAARFADLSRREQRLILLVVGLGWTVNLVFALRQSFVGFSGAETAFLQSGVSTYLVGNDARLLGAMRTNQDFGVLTAIAFPVLLAFSVLYRDPRRAVQITIWLLTAATAYVMFASLLRSTLVGGALAGILVLVLANASALGRRRIAALGLIVTATIAVMALASTGIDTSGDGRTAAAARRISTIFEPGGDKAVQARTSTTWPRAIAVLSAHPLGAGPGAAGPYSQQRADAPFGTLTPDNGYLLIALQIGVPGMLIFGWFAIGTAARLMRLGRTRDPLALGIGGSLVAVLVAMITGGIWGLVGPISVLCLLIGLASRPERLASPPSSPTPAP